MFTQLHAQAQIVNRRDKVLFVLSISLIFLKRTEVGNSIQWLKNGDLKFFWGWGVCSF